MEALIFWPVLGIDRLGRLFMKDDLPQYGMGLQQLCPRLLTLALSRNKWGLGILVGHHRSQFSTLSSLMVPSRRSLSSVTSIALIRRAVDAIRRSASDLASP
jgi:hypothetical protein